MLFAAELNEADESARGIDGERDRERDDTPDSNGGHDDIPDPNEDNVRVLLTRSGILLLTGN
jgi:hypothetical protein